MHKKGVITIIKLIKKAQKGDDKAFLKIFQTFEQDIYRMAYVYVKNKHDALDVVQEVAYRSFKKIDTLQHPEYLKSWLIKITITCSIDCIKQNRKVVQLKPSDEQMMCTEDEDIPLSLSVQQLIDVLNEDEKSIVILRFYHGYTFREIADLLEKPLGTIKSILYRALAKLRHKAKEAEICE